MTTLVDATTLLGAIGNIFPKYLLLFNKVVSVMFSLKALADMALAAWNSANWLVRNTAVVTAEMLRWLAVDPEAALARLTLLMLKPAVVGLLAMGADLLSSQYVAIEAEIGCSRDDANSAMVCSIQGVSCLLGRDRQAMRT
jgi:uncharacterized protein YqgC (DUF456 family)